MALNALVHATVAFVEVVLLSDTVGAPMWHVEIVADSLFLLIPPAVSMQSRRKIGSTLAVSRFLLWLTFWLWLLLRTLRFRSLPLG